MNIIDELSWRGAVNQMTDEEGLRKLTEEKSVSLYCGVDPTGDSMHIGHLIPFMMLKRFALAGHHPYVVIGGGTGVIGDPSGRKTERQLQTIEKIHENAEKLKAQFIHLFGESSNISFVNNYDWLSKIDLLNFLRDYGKLFSVNTMLAKEVVASRLEAGISFTEFSYQILQSIDFEHLFTHNDVQLQIGGADQWGNITAGIDTIHKMHGSDARAYGLTIPLMLKSDGTKFGKTAGGAVWLDPEKTSPFEFYQFWLNQDDADVVKYLKYFTFLSKEEIDALEEAVKTEPEKRLAQRRLAEEVTTFVHSPEALKEAQNITEALYHGSIADLTEHELTQAFGKMPTVDVSVDPLDPGIPCRMVPTAEDDRPLPPALATFLRADRVCDLDVYGSGDDPLRERFRELLARDEAGDSSVLSEVADLVSAYDAADALQGDDRVPLYCCNMASRVLAGGLELEGQQRFRKVPDSAFDARSVLCRMYRERDNLEDALQLAIELVGLAPTSFNAYHSLALVYRDMGKMPEAVQALIEGLKVASVPTDVACCYYRLGYFFWQMGQPQLGLACYALVRRDSIFYGEAQQEMDELMRGNHLSRKPARDEAQAIARAEGVPLAPVSSLVEAVATAALGLVDAGCFDAALMLVHFLSSTDVGPNSYDVLASVTRSLQGVGRPVR